MKDTETRARTVTIIKKGEDAEGTLLELSCSAALTVAVVDRVTSRCILG